MKLTVEALKEGLHAIPAARAVDARAPLERVREIREVKAVEQEAIRTWKHAWKKGSALALSLVETWQAHDAERDHLRWLLLEALTKSERAKSLISAYRACEDHESRLAVFPRFEALRVQLEQELREPLRGAQLPPADAVEVLVGPITEAQERAVERVQKGRAGATIAQTDARRRARLRRAARAREEDARERAWPLLVRELRICAGLVADENSPLAVLERELEVLTQLQERLQAPSAERARRTRIGRTVSPELWSQMVRVAAGALGPVVSVAALYAARPDLALSSERFVEQIADAARRGLLRVIPAATDGDRAVAVRWTDDAGEHVGHLIDLRRGPA